jgi:hypothetical protein
MLLLVQNGSMASLVYHSQNPIKIRIWLKKKEVEGAREK